jgi:hypothetical protein
MAETSPQASPPVCDKHWPPTTFRDKFYDIPEVDYSPEALADEMKQAGASQVLVIPHNIGGYLLARPAKGWWKTGRSVAYLALQVVGPLMPDGFKRRHAYSYIGIGSKV